MSRPLLQLALGHTSLQAAQRDVATLADHVDIVEAGTILCLTEGLNAVRRAGIWRGCKLDDHHLRRPAGHR